MIRYGKYHDREARMPAIVLSGILRICANTPIGVVRMRHPGSEPRGPAADPKGVTFPCSFYNNLPHEIKFILIAYYRMKKKASNSVIAYNLKKYQRKNKILVLFFSRKRWGLGIRWTVKNHRKERKDFLQENGGGPHDPGT